MGNDARSEKDALTRSRVTRFIGDPAAVEGLFFEEIRAAITGAIDTVIDFIREDDGSRLN